MQNLGMRAWFNPHDPGLYVHPALEPRAKRTGKDYPYAIAAGSAGVFGSIAGGIKIKQHG